MIVTKNWLNEWLDISDKSSDDICKTLNSIGLEVDSLKEIKIPKKVVVGYVKECKKHPDADKLSVCQVNVGNDILQIVCGAKNVRDGLYVPVALLGCELDEGFKIKKAKLRGVESNGMICSAKEIGLPDINDGILELDDSIGSLQIGKELCEYKLLNDDIIEVELTANRGDCLSVYGIARDLSAAYQRELNTLENIEDEDSALGIGRVLSVTSKDKDHYSSLMYRIFKKESLNEPLLIKLRLSLVGQSYKDAFDLYRKYTIHSTGVITKLYSTNICKDKNICKIELKKDKNGVEYIQINNMISYVGFKEDEKLTPMDKCKRVVLEASFADPDIISGYGRFFKDRDDELFYRTSRGSEPDLELGMTYFKNIISKYSTIEWYSGVEGIDNRAQNRVVNIYLSKIDALIGQDIQKNKIVSILKNLGFDVNVKDDFDLMSITIPSFRHDIKNAEDIVEEIVRIVGIDNIKSLPLEFVESNNQNIALSEYKKRLYFRKKAAANGFFEIINYIFTDSKKIKKLGFKDIDKSKQLINPVTNELNTLRASLLVGLLDSASRNYKYGKKSIRLFEIGTVFDSDRNESLMLSFIFSGEVERAAIRNQGKPNIIDFFTFAQKISSILGDFEIRKPEKELVYLSPYESGEIVKNGKVIGYIGRVHLDVEKEYDLPTSYICEIDFESLSLENKIVKMYSKYPAVERDFSFLVPKDMSYAKIKEMIKENISDEIINFYPIDIFESSELGSKISITVRFVLQSFNKTLNDQDISTALSPVLDALLEEGIKIR